MTPSPHSASRDLALDALRAAAIVGMMAAHTTRLIDFGARDGWPKAVLLLEPLIPSLFLLMVGVSLAFSFTAATARGASRGDWYRRQLKRAAGLWALSLLFYLAEHGPRFPDVVTASGILANIAYAIVLTATLLLSRLPNWALGSALIVGTGVLLRIDFSGQPVFPLTAGNAPFLPLWLFAFAGALWGLLHRRSSAATFWIGIAGLAGAAFLLQRHGLEALFTKPFGRSDAAREIAAPLFFAEVFGGEKRLGYYNLRPVLALFCLGAHLGLLALLGRGLGLLRGPAAKAASAAFILGRHSLPAYVLHLALLAALVTALGVRPLPTSAAGAATLFVVLGVCVAFSVYRERRKKRDLGSGIPPEPRAAPRP